jgi:hypothetical protein
MESMAPTGFSASIAARFQESFQTELSRAAENPKGIGRAAVFTGTVGVGLECFVTENQYPLAAPATATKANKTIASLPRHALAMRGAARFSTASRR